MSKRQVSKTRISRLYKLGRSQATLDFVDVDIKGDTKVFISPRALTQLPSEWGDECVSLIHSFFQTLLDHIKSGRNGDAIKLLEALKEPNETHLGLSQGKSRGRALGEGSALEVWQALSESEAAKSGLLKDLEDTVLLIPGIGVDIVSDMTTNIIRSPLISYTQQICHQFDIKLTPNVDSGPLWNPYRKEWYSKYVDLPLTSEGKLLLVPKAIVRRHLVYDLSEYYRHHILEHLRKAELSANGSLVYLLKNGEARVNKTDLIEKYGSGKDMIAKHTLKSPEILDGYRDKKAQEPYTPLSHDEFAAIEFGEGPDWDSLLSDVLNTKTGADDARAYEKSIESLLNALFYPDLTNPIPQAKLHNGSKIVDIQYTNRANGGFFSWISKHYPAALIQVECKNFGSEIANPELDQLLCRFSPSRGRIGLLLCRSFKNKERFQDRCKNACSDGHGFVIALDDADIAKLVDSRKNDQYYQEWPILKNRFISLLNNANQ